ncbi:MAG: hypothetical protein HBSAPP03_15900 [Phycisphaerae bacterium]|nr:MAG: hypothetical protein HBSAPP03_15900 [Phycisphaerae bacterium]
MTPERGAAPHTGAVMPDPDPNLEQAIRDNAAQPAKASVDGQSVEQHPLKDQIEADRYLASKDAARKPGLGVKFAKLVPPGSI